MVLYIPGGAGFLPKQSMYGIVPLHGVFGNYQPEFYGNQTYPRICPNNPWDWYIYLHEWLMCYGFHVGKNTSPMESMGNSEGEKCLPPSFLSAWKR